MIEWGKWTPFRDSSYADDLTEVESRMVMNTGIPPKSRASEIRGKCKHCGDRLAIRGENSLKAVDAFRRVVARHKRRKHQK